MKKNMPENTNELFVRIPIQNFKFEDSYEQSQLDEMILTDPDRAINYFENALKDMAFKISLN